MKKKHLSFYLPAKKHLAFTAYAKLNHRSAAKEVEFLVDCVLSGAVVLPNVISTERRAA